MLAKIITMIQNVNFWTRLRELANTTQNITQFSAGKHSLKDKLLNLSAREPQTQLEWYCFSKCRQKVLPNQWIEVTDQISLSKIINLFKAFTVLPYSLIKTHQACSKTALNYSYQVVKSVVWKENRPNTNRKYHFVTLVDVRFKNETHSTTRDSDSYVKM